MRTNYLLKKVFVSVVAVSGLLFSQANAQVVDGIAYNIIDGNAVEVAPLPKNGDVDVRYTQANIVIPASVKIGETTYPVKKIGNNSMRENPNLVSVTIPEGVEIIGNSSFASCALLPSVTLPASVKSIEDWSFYGCTKLESINIPDGITAITEHTFQQTGLKSITLPASVKSLKTCAFQDAKSLASINIENITALGAWSLYGTAITSANISNVNSILSEAFGECPNLETVKLTNVTTVGDWAFKNCPKLKSIDLGGAESINTGAFSGCKALTSLVIPNSVIYIGSWALEKTGLTEVFISWEDPAETVFIEEHAFGQDEGMPHITWKVPAEHADVYGSSWNGFPVATVTTGITNTQKAEVKAYFSNGTLNLTNASGCSASILSFDGRKLQQMQISSDNAQIPASLAPGVYLLNITNANTNSVIKFIVR